MGVSGGRGLGVGDGLGLSDVLEQHRDDGGGSSLSAYTSWMDGQEGEVSQGKWAATGNPGYQGSNTASLGK